MPLGQSSTTSIRSVAGRSPTMSVSSSARAPSRSPPPALTSAIVARRDSGKRDYAPRGDEAVARRPYREQVSRLAIVFL